MIFFYFTIINYICIRILVPTSAELNGQGSIMHRTPRDKLESKGKPDKEATRRLQTQVQVPRAKLRAGDRVVPINRGENVMSPVQRITLASGAFFLDRTQTQATLHRFKRENESHHHGEPCYVSMSLGGCSGMRVRLARLLRLVAIGLVVLSATRHYILNVGSVDPAVPKLHILTESTFMQQLFLSVMMFLVIFVHISELVPGFVHDSAYHEAMPALAQGTNGLAIWSIAGLFSSSCCIIQVLLNMLNVGCAGLNKYLGPWRPAFLGFSTVMQVAQWHQVLTHPECLWRAMIETFVFITLSFLPEALFFLQWGRREAVSTKKGERTTEIVLQVEGMGCSACATTVKAACKAESEVLSCCINFEEKEVRCLVIDSPGLSDRLCQRIAGAGFEPTLNASESEQSC